MLDSSNMTPEALKTLLESQNKLIEKLTQTVESLGERVPSETSALKAGNAGLSLDAIRYFYESLTWWTCFSEGPFLSAEAKANSSVATSPLGSDAKRARTVSSRKAKTEGGE